MSIITNQIKIQENVDYKQFNVANHVTQRDIRRQKWNQDFEANCAPLADRVSETIVSSVLNRFREHLSNPFKRIPSSSLPLESTFSLDICRPKKASLIQALAQEKADLEPFKEWFSVFNAVEKNQGEFNKKRDFEDEYDDSALSSWLSIPQSDAKKDSNYFHEQMAKIGRRIAATVNRQLGSLALQPENKEFRFKVEWYRKAEKALSSFSASEDNMLYVTTWIEPAAGKK